MTPGSVHCTYVEISVHTHCTFVPVRCRVSHGSGYEIIDGLPPPPSAFESMAYSQYAASEGARRPLSWKLLEQVYFVVCLVSRKDAGESCPKKWKAPVKSVFFPIVLYKLSVFLVQFQFRFCLLPSKNCFTLLSNPQ